MRVEGHPTLPRFPQPEIAQPTATRGVTADSAIQSRSTARRYGSAVLAAVLAAVIRWGLDRLVGYQHPYSIFYVAVLWSAWYGGVWPGLLATTLGGIAIALLGLLSTVPGAAASFLNDFEFYWVVCLAASILFEAQRRAQLRSATNAAIAQERWRALAREIVHRREAEEAAA